MVPASVEEPISWQNGVGLVAICKVQLWCLFCSYNMSNEQTKTGW